MRFERIGKKRKKMKSLGGFFRSFLPNDYRYQAPPKKKQQSKKDEFDFLELHMNWQKIVGEKLYKFTRPQKIFKQTLIIMTKHSQYAHHLIFMEEEIKSRIFALYPSLEGKIRNLRFEQNESFFEKKDFAEVNMSQERQFLERSQKFHPQSPAFKKLKSEAVQNFADVEDEEVKDALVKLFMQNKL